MTFASPSVPERLRQFFVTNPHEELTIEDISVKFGCTRATAENAVSIVRHVMGLERVTVYRLKDGA